MIKRDRDVVFFRLVNKWYAARKEGSRVDFNSKGMITPRRHRDTTPQRIEFELSERLLLDGDCQVIFMHHSILSKKAKMFQCWFHTRFIDRRTLLLRLTKKELDSACKDKKNRTYSADLVLEFEFEEVSSSTLARYHETQKAREAAEQTADQKQSEAAAFAAWVMATNSGQRPVSPSAAAVTTTATTEAAAETKTEAKSSTASATPAAKSTKS